jgi:thiamine pyrophosphate-dependent acetolactate synthase large subunit-like protein
VLPSEAVETIIDILANTSRPLVITRYVGRNKKCLEQLVTLANTIPGLQVLDCGGSDMCFPISHYVSQGFRLATDNSTSNTDVILIVDWDIPWILSLNPPLKDTKIYHVDVDPLNHIMPVSFFPANGR